ncbi:MAG: M48 family metallopeptidase [Gammaproteobacteria bacterium]|nr:M48 family metallopeptidase [Gammaproteobacteria bacterium]
MINYQLIRSKRKTLSLQIDRQACLLVRAPMCLSVKKIEHFINEKQNWIRKKQAEIESKTPPKQNYASGNEYLFLGELYPLQHIESGDPLSFNGQSFQFNTQYEGYQVFHWFYKKEFIKTAIPILERLADKHNLNYREVRFKAQKTRWGSCSARNNINLNYLLMMAPISVIEMVIAHELAHIVHKNHSKDFYALLTTMIPEHKQADVWLTQHSSTLHNL